ncbi:MAG: response regulator transcription factor [Ruminococcaceae bacterium]|nr:response regulator transcription factor [Oscillospiraceae bacterium]
MKFLYTASESFQKVVNILRYHGHTVDIVKDNDVALAFALAENYDCIITEEKNNGAKLLLCLREKSNSTPMLIISEKNIIPQEYARSVRYLCKPFSLEELLANLRTLCPSQKDVFPSSLSFGDITLCARESVLRGNGSSIMLSETECSLMEFFILNNGVYVPAPKILLRVWGNSSSAKIGIVWVYISYLRKKISSVSKKVKLKSKRNIGYILEII